MAVTEKALSNEVLIKKQRPPDVYIARSRIHGRGVFAARDFKAGEVVEACPFVFTGKASGEIHNMVYDFQGHSVLALGFGTLYNHSSNNNLTYVLDPETHCIVFSTKRPIKAHEELFSHYGDKWFSDRGWRDLSIAPAPAMQSHWRDFIRDLVIVLLACLVLYVVLSS